MYKVNTTNKNEVIGPVLLKLFSFVILIGFCLDSFLDILKSL